MKLPSIKNNIENFQKKIKLDVHRRNPQWFFYADGEEGYHPKGKDLIQRSIWNVLIFVGSIVLIIYFSILGMQTPVFLFLRNLSEQTQNKELLWLAYGTVLGIGGTLVFGSIVDPGKSVDSRIMTSISYIIYFGIFFVFLNILFYAILGM